MGEYSIPAVSDYGCASLFSGEEEDLEKIEKFNALKASRPEVVADAEDTYGICSKKKRFQEFYFF
jgi:hypothetical protein